jgi:hypothetical protein
MYTLARLGSKELPGMKDAFVKGVKLIIDNQNGRGSWSYGGIDAGKPYAYNKDSKGEDLSLAGWQFQALKAAKNSGLKIDGLHSAMDKMVDYILVKQTKDGGFGGANRDGHYNQWSLTGVGLWPCKQPLKAKPRRSKIPSSFSISSWRPSLWIGIKTAILTAGTTTLRPSSRQVGKIGSSTISNSFRKSSQLNRPMAVSKKAAPTGQVEMLLIQCIANVFAR